MRKAKHGTGSPNVHSVQRSKRIRRLKALKDDLTRLRLYAWISGLPFVGRSGPHLIEGESWKRVASRSRMQLLSSLMHTISSSDLQLVRRIRFGVE